MPFKFAQSLVAAGTCLALLGCGGAPTSRQGHVGDVAAPEYTPDWESIAEDWARTTRAFEDVTGVSYMPLTLALERIEAETGADLRNDLMSPVFALMLVSARYRGAKGREEKAAAQAYQSVLYEGIERAEEISATACRRKAARTFEMGTWAAPGTQSSARLDQIFTEIAEIEIKCDLSPATSDGFRMISGFSERYFLTVDNWNIAGSGQLATFGGGGLQLSPKLFSVLEGAHRRFYRARGIAWNIHDLADRVVEGDVDAVYDWLTKVFSDKISVTLAMNSLLTGSYLSAYREGIKRGMPTQDAMEPFSTQSYSFSAALMVVMAHEVAHYNFNLGIEGQAFETEVDLRSMDIFADVFREETSKFISELKDRSENLSRGSLSIQEKFSKFKKLEAINRDLEFGAFYIPGLFILREISEGEGRDQAGFQSRLMKVTSVARERCRRDYQRLRGTDYEGSGPSCDLPVR